VARRYDEKPLPPPMLVISKEEALRKINERIELGNKIKNSKIATLVELKYTRSEYYKWTEFNEELLSRIFDNTSIKDNYKRTVFTTSLYDVPLAEKIEELRDDFDYYLRNLESIRDRLELIAVSPKVVPQLPLLQQTLHHKSFLRII